MGDYSEVTSKIYPTRYVLKDMPRQSHLLFINTESFLRTPNEIDIYY